MLQRQVAPCESQPKIKLPTENNLNRSFGTILQTLHQKFVTSTPAVIKAPENLLLHLLQDPACLLRLNGAVHQTNLSFFALTGAKTVCLVSILDLVHIEDRIPLQDSITAMVANSRESRFQRFDCQTAFMQNDKVKYVSCEWKLSVDVAAGVILIVLRYRNYQILISIVNTVQ